MNTRKIYGTTQRRDARGRYASQGVTASISGTSGTVITVRPHELPEFLAKGHKEKLSAIEKAARAAAMRLKAYLVKRTNELGITDRGIYKNSFKVLGNTVYNEAPHAGIIELGARPHPVSIEGRKAIKAWAMRKLRLSEEEAERAAFLIARKIAKEGQAPRYVMRDALPMAIDFFAQELKRISKSNQVVRT